ncbi:PREDICTED: bZIP transcription factor 2 [Tarenaya hassleriana]|uniref:bZIP transcription factor 2 n=1 Tax=Tarenaya hassleriana TaxID=28532 RepID=UPI00053C287B|nr:PREDICTED: bZIP transcription factor 2 [Tarenaya hassleriana]
MMSTIPPVFSSEPGLANPFPAFETGFTPWDGSDIFSMFNSSEDEPVETKPGFEKHTSPQTQAQTNSSSGSDDKSQNRFVSDMDERRKKRKISNRESARRSRMRKQKHLENMRTQLNRLRIENRELTNRLRYVVYHCQRARAENDHLWLEHRILVEKLSNMRHVSMLRRMQQASENATWPCNDSTVVTAQQNPSMLRNHVVDF